MSAAWAWRTDAKVSSRSGGTWPRSPPPPVAPAAPARHESDRPRPGPASVRPRRSSAPLAAGRTPHAIRRLWRRAASPDRIQSPPASTLLCSWRQPRPARAAARPGYRHSPRRVAGPSVGSLPPLRSRVPPRWLLAGLLQQYRPLPASRRPQPGTAPCPARREHLPCAHGCCHPPERGRPVLPRGARQTSRARPRMHRPWRRC